MPRKLVPDMWLFAAVVALVSVGVVMVYSASAIIAADRFRDPYFFLKKQLFWAVLGFGCLWAAMTLNYRILERIMLPLLVVSLVLLVLVLVPPFSQEINGTRRWFRWGPVSFQPAELAKFSLVVYLAHFLTRRREVVESFWLGLLPPLLVAGSMAGVGVLPPDLAWGSGGLFGRGLGESKQKLFYLPEPHTDFIFAVLGEELGLLGAVSVIGLFGLLIWRGVRIGVGAPDPFGAPLALGLTALLACQTLVNLGVVTGALPTKGLPLPFISFGGSALIMAMVSVGVLLNLSQHARDV